MPTVVAEPYETIKEFEPVAAAIKALRTLREALDTAGRQSDLLAARKALILGKVLRNLDKLTMQFNTFFVEQSKLPETPEKRDTIELAKMLLHMNMVLVVSDAVDAKDKKHLAKQRSSVVGFLQGTSTLAGTAAAAIGGFALGGPAGAVIGAYAGYRTSSGVVHFISGSTESANKYNLLYNALLNVSLPVTNLSPSTRQKAESIMKVLTDRSTIHQVDATLELEKIVCAAGRLYVQKSEGCIECNDGEQIYSLSRVLRECAVRTTDLSDDAIRLAYMSVRMKNTMAQILDPTAECADTYDCDGDDSSSSYACSSQPW